MLELVALGTDPAAGRALASSLGGVAYACEVEHDRELPFRSLVRVTTSDLDDVGPAADIGTYLVYSRQMRRHPDVWRGGLPTPGIVGAFGLVHLADLGHQQGDAHWRDVHAPLALQHHVGMWDYVQCSVVRVLDGPAYDGFALCGFGSETDFKERFFDGPDGKAAILADIAKFADTTRSPRRVLTTEWDHRG